MCAFTTPRDNGAHRMRSGVRNGEWHMTAVARGARHPRSGRGLLGVAWALGRPGSCAVGAGGNRCAGLGHAPSRAHGRWQAGPGSRALRASATRSLGHRFVPQLGNGAAAGSAGWQRDQHEGGSGWHGVRVFLKARRAPAALTLTGFLRVAQWPRPSLPVSAAPQAAAYHDVRGE